MTLFIDNLMEALRINSHLKVSGFCFGHQLIAQAFGARVEKKSLARGL
jgi:GMP synthase-like glutamine amidotransferase